MKHGRFERCDRCFTRRCRCPSRVSGFIYFLQSDYNGLIKVGYTTDITKRFGSLRASNAASIGIIKVVLGNFFLESEIKRFLKFCQHHNEWFYPHDKLLAFIDSLVDRQKLDVREIRKALS
jgi:hypothetical protein